MLCLDNFIEEQRSRGQEVRLEIESKMVRKSEGKLINDRDHSDISLQPLTEINPSTLQPFNLSTYNSLSFCPPDLYSSLEDYHG